MQLIRSLWLLLLVTGFSQSQPYASSEASLLPLQDCSAALLQHSSDWLQHSDSHDDHDAATLNVTPSLLAFLQQTASHTNTVELAATRNPNPARAPPVLSF
ncbi:hypothetical protein ABC502_05120 [Alkalimonas sp. NCh-2]|uniref:hypothetical protein n=1 Tax=Alkalimonas sp. NCh-2 TaxID=3144846 RepID=UPI0031F67D73